MTDQNISHEHVIDRDTGKLGMWIFLFTELFLFGGLFLVYSVFRVKYHADFHHAAEELDVFIGTLNTIVLLISSMTVAMAITAIQKNQKGLSIFLLIITILLALTFMVNKYFEWGHKFELHLVPRSDVFKLLPNGEKQFFFLYFSMTGLHALHVLVGSVLLAISAYKIKSGGVNQHHFVMLENSGLYWHLVDLIWIFLFPLLYLIT
jgi:cytochrome c oxidase subunit 3